MCAGAVVTAIGPPNSAKRKFIFLQLLFNFAFARIDVRPCQQPSSGLRVAHTYTTNASMLCCALYGLARCAVIEKHALAVRLSGTLTDDYPPLSQVSG